MINNTSMKIAKKYWDAIDEVFKDVDGYWINLNEGYYISLDGMECIHEETQKEVMQKIKYITKKSIPFQEKYTGLVKELEEYPMDFITITKKEIYGLLEYHKQIRSAGFYIKVDHLGYNENCEHLIEILEKKGVKVYGCKNGRINCEGFTMLRSGKMTHKDAMFQ